VDLKSPQDFLTLDPVAMNVVSRVAAGCRLYGKLHFDGGLLVQGELSGQIRVEGPLIIWAGARVRGRIQVLGDLFLFGQVGDIDAEPIETSVECTGTVCVADSGLSTGTLLARRLQLYEGAQVQGPFKTLREGQELPVLSEVFEESA
jgi:cytoskeletal protein CcmA (bactofilin family)